MNNVDSTQRTNFFPQSKGATSEGAKSSKVNPSVMKRNDYARAKELSEMGQRDAKVNISEAIKDFSRIKKAVDTAPEQRDNSEKIAQLKSQIQNGTYKVDYDALADKVLGSEY